MVLPIIGLLICRNRCSNTGVESDRKQRSPPCNQSLIVSRELNSHPSEDTEPFHLTQRPVPGPIGFNKFVSDQPRLLPGQAKYAGGIILFPGFSHTIHKITKNDGIRCFNILESHVAMSHDALLLPYYEVKFTPV